MLKNFVLEFFMHTGTPRKMPAKLAGARRASRGNAFPYSISQFRVVEDVVKEAHGVARRVGKNFSHYLICTRPHMEIYSFAACGLHGK